MHFKVVNGKAERFNEPLYGEGDDVEAAMKKAGWKYLGTFGSDSTTMVDLSFWSKDKDPFSSPVLMCLTAFDRWTDFLFEDLVQALEYANRFSGLLNLGVNEGVLEQASEIIDEMKSR